MPGAAGGPADGLIETVGLARVQTPAANCTETVAPLLFADSTVTVTGIAGSVKLCPTGKAWFAPVVVGVPSRSSLPNVNLFTSVPIVPRCKSTPLVTPG